MICPRFKVISRADGKTSILAAIIAEEAPSEFPLTGENVDRLDANYVFSPGSRLMAVSENKTYMLDSNYEWHAWSSGSGGGGSSDEYATQEEVDGFIDGLFNESGDETTTQPEMDDFIDGLFGG